MRNTISKLYKAVSAPVATTRDALTERLQSVRETPVWTRKIERHYRKRSKGRRGRNYRTDKGRRGRRQHRFNTATT